METPRCRCGHDRDNKFVTADAIHGPLGYLRLMIGGTPTPKKVTFRCTKCNQVFDESEERSVRERYL
jgi:hypothetical protein